MPARRRSEDAAALSVLLDMLRHVERELGFLDAPVPDASASVGQAVVSIEAALKLRRGQRAPSRRR